MRRVDKHIPLSSAQLEREIEREVVATTGAPVNLRSLDIEITFRVYRNSAVLFGPKIPVVVRLHAGEAGNVLTFLSGGTDSAVAAWLAIRCGCRTDFYIFINSPRLRKRNSRKSQLQQSICASAKSLSTPDARS